MGRESKEARMFASPRRAGCFSHCPGSARLSRAKRVQAALEKFEAGPPSVSHFVASTLQTLREPLKLKVKQSGVDLKSVRADRTGRDSKVEKLRGKLFIQVANLKLLGYHFFNL